MTYKGNWINPENYDIQKVTLEESPIHIYKGPTPFDLKPGLYQFILYTDENYNLTLVMSFFNPLEYGNRHAMLDYRVDTPESNIPINYLFSGELYITGRDKVYFHDKSTFSFGSPDNMIHGSALFYFEHFLENNPTMSLADLKKNILRWELLKKNGDLRRPTSPQQQIKQAPNVDALKKILKHCRTEKGDDVLDYYHDTTLRNIVQYTFNQLFPRDHFILEYMLPAEMRRTLEQSGSRQFDRNVFLDQLCEKGRNFDVYPNEVACHKQRRVLRNSSCKTLTQADFPAI
jgi:hypothetical protein